MVRQEQILNNAIDYSLRVGVCQIEYDDCGDVCDDKMFVQKAFEEGAKWADKTMIDKACKWLLNVDFDCQQFRDCDESFNNDLLVDAFKKTMKE